MEKEKTIVPFRVERILFCEASAFNNVALYKDM